MIETVTINQRIADQRESGADDAFHYETVHIDQMEYDEQFSLFRYPCPCGDTFEISVSDLLDGERVAVCPTCSLTILIDDHIPIAEYIEKRRISCV